MLDTLQSQLENHPERVCTQVGPIFYAKSKLYLAFSLEIGYFQNLHKTNVIICCTKLEVPYQPFKLVRTGSSPKCRTEYHYRFTLSYKPPESLKMYRTVSSPRRWIIPFSRPKTLQNFISCISTNSLFNSTHYSNKLHIYTNLKQGVKALAWHYIGLRPSTQRYML